MSNPKELLISFIKKDDIKSIKKLLKKNPMDVNFIHGHGFRSVRSTPLLYAANRGFTNIVKLLLEHGADINKIDSWGESALIKASREGHKNVVRLLLNSGANPLIRNINSNKDFIAFADDCISNQYPERKKVTNYLKMYDVQKSLLEKYLDLYHSFKKMNFLHPDIAIEYDFVEKGMDLGLL